ncbi:glutamate racemase [Candidatus Falkowbacteria bacterium RIFOXYB2_FULL_47_14]|uniref:Glutamate racemase n=1 Tax=Candidatus Falkowbacteria bacterium RIFOXYA2_FULL_47_19 TaxID=1797994 RepID=A0A1F5SGD7_9BACT|nr:MAG: glutamate racemase [Candidatus Falkowbacteria bacterium RIFOXYA2_FULL_47_19]OGF34916.1 MAG: glutamate racemase [Candidatus Falkowbacteria bacterium RIFOXYC2_FULL_46_15]OGF43631.1 MAG: glutamate racemase [Candidatus Falkowbacteria bacterium RIFOXYB2_FULL_47_14]
MIGVFDSGFGGLTVLSGLVKELPEYNYIYLGDNARAPYGNKSLDVIYNYTCEAVDFLFKHNCELIIIACNTVSAKALRKIQQEYLPKNYPGKRVLGVIIPVVETVIEEARQNLGNKPVKIGLIGTKTTINSKVYDEEIKKLSNENTPEIFSVSTPLLVPLIEEGWIKKIETKMILRKYLRSLKKEKIDYLILGCTHYPFLQKDIQGIVGKKIKIISTPAAAAVKLKDYLLKHNEIDIKLIKNKQRRYFTTDDPDKFREFGNKFLPELNIIKIDKVEL